MDVETEKIMELLFPSGVPDSWKENPEFYQYLSKIGDYDVTSLNKEPELLTDERNSVEQNTQDLVFSNYKTFIKTAENSREIHTEFDMINEKLEKLLIKIPNFTEQCKSFCSTSKNINSLRKLNTLTLSKTAELLEILELPQLMETCLRNNLYTEALELSQYARHLSTKHGSIPIIANMVNQIENSWSVMVNQVIDSLKEDLPLPKCLELTGLLRSMDAFSEPELRIKFLQARDSWFQGLLNAIPKEDANIHLIKTIELSRIHLFNIITQYTAMFNDDDHLALGRDVLINDSAIFYQWLEEKISQFLFTLENDLPNVTVDSVLDQCTYFALSFGRVGADFSGRMAHIFIGVIKKKFENDIANSTLDFIKNMESFEFLSKSNKLDMKVETTIVNSENPPEQLLDYYPMAEYCNGLIEAFNELRINPPVALAQDVTTILQNSLCQVSNTISAFLRRKEKFSDSDKETFVRFVECFAEQLVPYVQICIHLLFPTDQVAEHFGTSISQLQKDAVTYLNKKNIVDPLTQFLPVRTLPLDLVEPEDSGDLINEAINTSDDNVSVPLVVEGETEENTEEKIDNPLEDLSSLSNYFEDHVD